MSKLVDDAVSDYFSLLLTDNTAETELAEAVMSSAEQEPARQLQRQSKAEVKEYAVKERVSSQALEQLLAPVSGAQPSQAVVGSQLEQPQVQQALVDEKAITKADRKAAIDAALVSKAVTPKSTVTVEIDPVSHQQLQESPPAPPSVTKDLVEQLDDEFQVLFFKVAGLTLAVPLVSLGGIVNLDRINHLMGRPGWYLGVQQHRESQLNVVDTCAWVMPEKYDDLAQSVNYQYIVVLQDSSWGLTCESLVNTVKIHKSQVNWRSQAGKRPWLAGVVKEQMCGILNVDALIAMLDSGLGSQG
ncbi:chemotaxis protein CheW [Shewanella sp. 10N.286.45.A1]|uniref:chemotaxis protein CheW n=1 Tax=Shewanella sp. 10N.286.45.A1 TaxID=3229694 RepID=UPI00354D1D10